MSNKDLISRRTFIASAAVIPLAISLNMTQSEKKIPLYVGTYTSGKSVSKGIYYLSFNAVTGELSAPRIVAETDDPSFIALSKNGKYLYAVNETLKYEGKDSGYVSAYEIDKKSGDLTFVNRQATHGAAPCHLSVSDTGKLLLVANYLGGNVAVFPVNKDGSLEPASNIAQHIGSGPNKKRQEAPHAHSVVLDHKHAFVNDLGIDKIMVYEINEKEGKLTPVTDGVSAKPGAGPRHFKIHPNRHFAYYNNEMDVTVVALAYDHKTATFTELQTLSSLPNDDKTRRDSGADLHISPNGKFLYASNRGDDSIAVFEIDEKTGMLTMVECVKTGGKTPRNFAIDPKGNFLLAANQDSDVITIFKINRETGKLVTTSIKADVPKPVCLVFAE